MVRKKEGLPDYRAGVCRLLARLADGPATYEELRAASGMAYSTTRTWIMALRATPHPHSKDKQAKMVRVCAYDKSADGRATVHVYELNTEARVDVRKPTPKKSSVRQREMLARRKALALQDIWRRPVQSCSAEPATEPA